jgi:pyridoxal phosphate enzyme (YggS family)
MTELTQRYQLIKAQIRKFEAQYHRDENAVSLIAVSKSHPTESIYTLYQSAQKDFAESYLQESLKKISALSNKDITWHYIGAIQTNKISDIAHNFAWVQSVSRLKEAQLLSEHRLAAQSPLNICIQIKLDDNPKKTGVVMTELPALVNSILDLPRLKLRGLMCLPPFSEDFDMQRKYFSLVRTCFEKLNQGLSLDTLSMGMTHDLEAAIAEGTTMVRVGTGLFGQRNG